MAWRDVAWRGVVLLVLAWFGVALHGVAWRCMALHGGAWRASPAVRMQRMVEGNATLVGSGEANARGFVGLGVAVAWRVLA